MQIILQHMRAAAIQFTAASGWRTSRGGSPGGWEKNEKRKKKPVLFNKSAEITVISQRQDNDDSSAAKKMRSVRDRNQEVHSQPDAHPSSRHLPSY